MWRQRDITVESDDKGVRLVDKARHLTIAELTAGEAVSLGLWLSESESAIDATDAAQILILRLKQNKAYTFITTDAPAIREIRAACLPGPGEDHVFAMKYDATRVTDV